jgi:glyoxylate reductase
VDVNTDGTRILPKDMLCTAVREHDILFALLHDTVDREVLTANPNLKAVTSMSGNADRIDLAVATAHKIPVTAIPVIAVSEATADLHFGLMLAVARRTLEGDRLIRAGYFPGAQSAKDRCIFGHTFRIGQLRRDCCGEVDIISG